MGLLSAGAKRTVTAAAWMGQRDEAIDAIGRDKCVLVPGGFDGAVRRPGASDRASRVSSTSRVSRGSRKSKVEKVEIRPKVPVETEKRSGWARRTGKTEDMRDGN